jgi:hypothetical protein
MRIIPEKEGQFRDFARGPNAGWGQPTCPNEDPYPRRSSLEVRETLGGCPINIRSAHGPAHHHHVPLEIRGAASGEGQREPATFEPSSGVVESAG